MKHGENARVEELDDLKLALTTFALHLDAFEMRTKDILLKAGGPEIPVRWPDNGRGLREGSRDWRSIRSHGNRWGT
jgi:hypothetical protein